MNINYAQFAKELRKTVLKMTYNAQSSHIGSNFSCADILSVLYNIADLRLDATKNLTRDIVIIKSWAAASVYASLVMKDCLPDEAIFSYGTEGTQWTTVLEPIPPYIPVGTGAMGYHLPFAVGFALAKKIKNELGNVYCLISDGETQIGSTWESALIAAHHKLGNLVLIVDRNGLQAMGKMEDILNIEPLEKKFQSFGWDWKEIDGHNHGAIEFALRSKHDKPLVIIANTVKGKGVSFMENENLWHYSHVNKEALEQGLKELE